MKIEEKTLEFDSRLWVAHGGVDVKEKGGRVILTAKDEDSYLKVFNHFGRVLKLYTFENGCWVDAETGLSAQPFDESQAGHLPESKGGKARSKAGGAAAASPAPKKKAGKAVAARGKKPGAAPKAKSTSKSSAKGGRAKSK